MDVFYRTAKMLKRYIEIFKKQLLVVITRYRVQYRKYFLNFSNFAFFFCQYCTRQHAITTSSWNTCWNQACLTQWKKCISTTQQKEKPETLIQFTNALLFNNYFWHPFFFFLWSNDIYIMLQLIYRKPSVTLEFF